MTIHTSLPLFDECLDRWKTALGEDYTPYRNHGYRMMHFCFALQDCDETARQKIMIAACFHDLGIWSDQTVDYLPPSVGRAREFMAQSPYADWSDEVALMIDEHHKLRAYSNPQYPLVEVFRKADLVDVSLGLVRFGIPAATVQAVQAAFPNVGFHKRLMRLSGQWFSQHPLRVPPFFKW